MSERLITPAEAFELYEAMPSRLRYWARRNPSLGVRCPNGWRFWELRLGSFMAGDKAADELLPYYDALAVFGSLVGEPSARDWREHFLKSVRRRYMHVSANWHDDCYIGLPWVHQLAAEFRRSMK